MLCNTERNCKRIKRKKRAAALTNFCSIIITGLKDFQASENDSKGHHAVRYFSTRMICSSTCLFEPLHRKVGVLHGGAVHVAEAPLSDLPGCWEIVRPPPDFVKLPAHDARVLRRAATARMLSITGNKLLNRLTSEVKTEYSEIQIQNKTFLFGLGCYCTPVG